MMRTSFVLKGNLCQAVTAKELDLHEQAYAVCVDGVSKDVFVAHCPASNMNLTSGIAPIRKYGGLDEKCITAKFVAGRQIKMKGAKDHG